MPSNNSNSKRLVSLDVFRGLTMVTMIMVNGLYGMHAYPLLTHASWDGCTLADLVFPAFLFIVGVTLVISFNYHGIYPRNKATTVRELKSSPLSHRELYSQILIRSLVLILLGIVLNAIPNMFDLDTLRYYGVLQRIGVCYFFSSLIYLHVRTSTLVVLFWGILIAYWLLLTQIPLPGIGAGHLTPDASWPAYIDQHLFSAKHLFNRTYDPEGLLGAISSLSNTLAGVLTGVLLLSSQSQSWKIAKMLSIGVVFCIIGWNWGWYFPINKNLWTSSFVLMTSGLSLIIFALCYIFIDLWGYKKWSLPLQIFGMNALVIFIFHIFCLKIQNLWQFTLADGRVVNLKTWVADYLFGRFSPENASLFFSLSFLLLNFVVAVILYKRKIFIKI